MKILDTFDAIYTDEVEASVRDIRRRIEAGKVASFMVSEGKRGRVSVALIEEPDAASMEDAK